MANKTNLIHNDTEMTIPGLEGLYTVLDSVGSISYNINKSQGKQVDLVLQQLFNDYIRHISDHSAIDFPDKYNGLGEANKTIYVPIGPVAVVTARDEIYHLLTTSGYKNTAMFVMCVVERLKD